MKKDIAISLIIIGNMILVTILAGMDWEMILVLGFLVTLSERHYLSIGRKQGLIQGFIDGFQRATAIKIIDSIIKGGEEG